MRIVDYKREQMKVRVIAENSKIINSQTKTDNEENDRRTTTGPTYSRSASDALKEGERQKMRGTKSFMKSKK